jgi:hypothetical protein
MKQYDTPYHSITWNMQWWAAKFLTRGSHFASSKFFLNTNHSKLHLNFHLALFLLYFSLCYLLLINFKTTVTAALHTKVDWTWLFSGIKSSLGSQKLGLGSSKPISKYFCISFRLTFVAKTSKINQSIWNAMGFEFFLLKIVIAFNGLRYLC